MGKERDEAFVLLEDMASNSYHWQLERETPRKVAGVHELDVSAIHAQLELLTKKLDTSIISAIQTQISFVIHVKG